MLVKESGIKCLKIVIKFSSIKNGSIHAKKV